ncbi:Intein/homing endonuclease [Pseudomonas syringae pv. actinidiae]|uniref:Intein/homing endonuclease n=1 Tax=Pseudomonas syringae pv. actinidiae TaxID=103796 RepID=A0AAN4TPP3_PSESF|nr:Intein/homing endonuclease [Pseudomonas syringae pv. actinidiae]
MRKARLDAVHQRACTVTQALHAILGFQRAALTSVHVGKAIESCLELATVVDQVLSCRRIASEQTVGCRTLQHGQAQDGRNDVQVLSTDALLGDGVDARVEAVEHPQPQDDERNDNDDG